MVTIDPTLRPYRASISNQPNPSISRHPVGAVLHHMVGFLPGTSSWFRNPACGYATNLGIGSLDRENYIVHEYVPVDRVAWGNGNLDLNTRSVSIEHENNRAISATAKPNEHVHELSAQVLAGLATRFDWRIDGQRGLVLADFPRHDFYGRAVPDFGRRYNVVGHRAVALKDCPAQLDMRWIVDRANGILGSGVVPAWNGVGGVVERPLDDDWDYWEPSIHNGYGDLARRVQWALANRNNRFGGPERYAGLIDGLFGTLTRKGIQLTLNLSGTFNGNASDGAVDGDVRRGGCIGIQTYARRFGGYDGPIDAKLGRYSWEGFARGLELP